MRPSATTVATYPANQWAREGFYNLVEQEKQREEAQIVVAYGSSGVNRDHIRIAVLDAILAHAIPAGNA